jgi:hypothetical protein
MLGKEKELVRDVQFKTIFRVYLCLLELKQASTKDVQKAMSFPTPAQAKYHLARLIEMGLITQSDDGTYKALNKKFGLLRFFFKLRGRMVPMSLFYSFFFAFVSIFLYLKAPSIELLLLGALIVAKESVDTYSYFAMV